MKKKRECVCGIYVIRNTVNGKCYVGQSVDIYHRWYTHQNPKTWEGDRGKVLYRAFIKYGIENFTFEILEECSRKQLDTREQYWISHLGSYKSGYNMTKGGQGNSNRDWMHRRKRKCLAGDDGFFEYLFTKHHSIYGTFEEMKSAICPDINNIEDVEDDGIQEEIDGYDTMFRDLCDGYDTYEQWAECNLI